MTPRLLLALLLPMALVTAAPADDKADPADLEKGTWKVVGLNEAGQDRTADIKQANLSFTFKDKKLTIKSAGDTKEGTFEIVEGSKPPYQIDLKMEKDKTDKAIYEFNKDKDTLKIAIGVPDRPTDFKGGPKIAVFTLERGK